MILIRLLSNTTISFLSRRLQFEYFLSQWRNLMIPSGSLALYEWHQCLANGFIGLNWTFQRDDWFFIEVTPMWHLYDIFFVWVYGALCFKFVAAISCYCLLDRFYIINFNWQLNSGSQIQTVWTEWSCRPFGKLSFVKWKKLRMSLGSFNHSW